MRAKIVELMQEPPLTEMVAASQPIAGAGHAKPKLDSIAT